MSVLALSDAKIHLNITSTKHDAELQLHINAAESAIGRRCGPLAPVAKTKRVIGGGRAALILPVSPVISLTSVTGATAGSLTLADLYLDADAGVVSYSNGDTFTDRYYDVSYQAGRAVLEGDLLHGLKEMVRHLWSESQRGSPLRPGSPDMDRPANYLANTSDELPFEVMQLIAAEMREGFA